MATTVAQRPAAREGAVGVLELGTNSLKLHLSRGGEVTEPLRVEWDLGFEAYDLGQLSEESIGAALSQVRDILKTAGADPEKSPVFGIATGVFRHALNCSTLLDRLYEEHGVPVRVLTADEEASLLKEGVHAKVPERPGMAFDLGGGSLDIVYFGKDGFYVRRDLNLGVICITSRGKRASGDLDERQVRMSIENGLKDALVFRLPAIHGTGGTVKAIAQVVSAPAVSARELGRLETKARRNGAPQELSPRRRELFLPGLMVVRGLMNHVGADTLHYTGVDLGEVLLSRLARFRRALRGPIARSFLLHDLDVFRPEDGLPGGVDPTANPN